VLFSEHNNQTKRVSAVALYQLMKEKHPQDIASKHAVQGLTKPVALEFAKQNIRINAIAQGVIATEMCDRFAGDGLRDQVASIIPWPELAPAKRSPRRFSTSVPTTRNLPTAHR
jgi:NAD(P)-dependent dehydrogenase (short-subunit alcohol dehydrogenase family)